MNRTVYSYLWEKLSKLILDNYYMSTVPRRKHATKWFRRSFRLFSFGVINMLRHRKHMLHPTEHLRKHAEKWSGSAVSAATETWVNVMILSTGTRVSRYVSAIKTKVSATFPKPEFWFLVLCNSHEKSRRMKFWQCVLSEICARVTRQMQYHLANQKRVISCILLKWK